MNFMKYHVSRNVMPAGELKTVENNGITFSSDGNGHYHISGTATAYASARFNLLPAFTTPISVSNGGQGTLSFFNTQSDNNVTFVFYNGTTKVDDWKQAPSNRVSTAYNVIGNKYVNSIVITVGSGTTVDMTITPEFTNDGVLPSEFEPYSSEVWHDIPHYIHNTSTDTITTLPAVLYPNETTATVGLKGNTVQSGTPTPQNPIQPSETGERTGNLWSGGNVSIAVGDRYKNTLIDLPTNTYTFKAKYSSTNTGSVTIGFYDENNTIHTYNMTQIDGEVSASYTGIITAIRLYSAAGYTPSTSYSAAFTDIMLNTGSTPLPYEPYGYKIPISSASTTTTVYLGEVQTERKIKKLVLTGDEAFSQPGTYPGGYLYMFIPSDIPGDNGANAVSTHYKQAYNNNGQNVYIQSGRIVIIDATHSTRDDFKSYLAAQYAAGTPVTVWYVLATEETGIVNEPLMRIGDYADTLSGVSIPVTAGGDTLLVDTTVQPSEVTVNYKGWHPVADVHEFTGNYTVGTMQTLPISELETHTISDLQGGEWS